MGLHQCFIPTYPCSLGDADDGQSSHKDGDDKTLHLKVNRRCIKLSADAATVPLPLHWRTEGKSKGANSKVQGGPNGFYPGLDYENISMCVTIHREIFPTAKLTEMSEFRSSCHSQGR